MKVAVFGTKKLDFLSNDGNQVKGRQVFIGFEANGVDGMMTDKIFLSDVRFANVDIVVGLDYDIDFNRFGKVEAISKA